MSDEFDALVQQGTWDLVPASPNHNVIGLAKGFHQWPGHDYSNIFSPVIKPTTIRIVFTIAKSKMDGAKTVATPMSSSGLSPQNGSPTLSDATTYRNFYMHCPTELHWQAVKHILRYLKDTMFHGLLIWSSSNLTLHAFSDSDWAAIARSSTEAEYRALAAASSKLVWVLHLLSELGLHSGNPPVLYCDNVGATDLSSNPVMHSCMKHIAIDLHFIRDLVDKRILRVSYIASVDQLADGLTKPLSSICFALLCSKIGVIDGSTILRGRIKETSDIAPSIMAQSHKGYQD
ncbi:hypothetical protein SLEP1_g55316 [Rubroshorea leprosula]|uniref:Retrovirus-related Pol polyprotein from transposon RE2 n=1 Tax=Rubroshorea leprosula TaxID=152421 RepID=A0AAV5MJ70_9ROSI|nr:hypothetical protein SLEP1_g55316 [Rubroshorea leprosula]